VGLASISLTLELYYSAHIPAFMVYIPIGENNCLVFLQTLDGWVYIDLYMGLLMGHYTWAQYTPNRYQEINPPDSKHYYIYRYLHGYKETL